MGFAELFILAIGLSMDAFAISVSKGLTMAEAGFKKALVVGLYFGFFQAFMPVIGYFAATLFAEQIIAYDHWVAFGLLLFIGAKMIIGGFKKEESPGDESISPGKMLPLAVATSIDALAVGVSFAFLKTNIVFAVILIGVVTLILSVAGVKIGKVFGAKLKSKAEIAGGVILILIGLKILLEHLGIINF